MSTDNLPSLLLEVESVYDDLCPKSEDEDEPMDPDNRAEYDVTVGDHDYCTRRDAPPHDGRSRGRKSGNLGAEGARSHVSMDKKDTAQRDSSLAPVTNVQFPNNGFYVTGMPSLSILSQGYENQLRNAQIVLLPVQNPSSQILRRMAASVSGASPAVNDPKKTLNQIKVTKSSRSQSHVRGKDLKHDYSKKSKSSSQSRKKQAREAARNQFDEDLKKKYAIKYMSISQRKDKQVQRKRSFVSVRDRTCTHCGIVLSTLGAFKSHVHHHTNDLISCSNCPKKFGNLAQYRGHKCGELRICSCYMCGEQFYNLVQLRIHKKKFHEDAVVSYDMDVNSKQLASSFIKKTQSKTYWNKDYECKECGKKFQKEEPLQRHCIMKHTNVAAYVCPTCGKKFRHRQTYRLHCRMHSTNLPFVCNECGCKFPTRGRLLEHKTTHTGEKKFPCSECDNRYRQKKTLKYHLVRVHGFSPEKIGMQAAGRVLCDICGLSLIRKSLKRHLSLHAGIRPGTKEKKDSTPEEQTRKKSQDQQFLCSQCGSGVFTSKENLNRHIRDVHGDNRFTCVICSESFKYRMTYKSHMAVHTNERPFKCDQCGKDFTCRKNFRSHVQRNHTTSHVCFYCKETIHGLYKLYEEHLKKCKVDKS